MLLNKQAKSLQRMLCALTGIQNIHVTAVSDGVSSNPSRTIIKTKYQINIEIVSLAQELADNVQKRSNLQARKKAVTAELTAMRHKSFKKGLEEGKRQNTAQMFVSDDEKPLLDAITACQKQNFELLAKISRKDSLINRLLRRLDRANIKYDDILANAEFPQVSNNSAMCAPMLEEGIEM